MNLLNHFLRHRRGTVAVTFAIGAVPLAGVSGAAVDYSRAVQVRHRLEIATDAAALSAAAMKTSSPAELSAAAERIVRAGLSPDLNVSVVVSSVSDATTTSVDVSASASVKTSLLQVLRISNVAVAAHSKAARLNTESGPPPCVLALNKTAAAGIDIGGSATFDGRSCVLHANSSATGALKVSGSAKVNAGGYCAVGTVTSYYALTPAPTDRCRPMVDTYAGLKAPDDTVCRQNLTNVSVSPNQKKTLSPGVYCGGLSLKGDVTLSPGLYVIKNGQLSMNSSGTISGTGVTFYLTGTNARVRSEWRIEAGTCANNLRGLRRNPFWCRTGHRTLAAQNKINGNATTMSRGSHLRPDPDHPAERYQGPLAS